MTLFISSEPQRHMSYNIPMRYFLYARKSTDVEDKQVLSIEAQLAELRALAKSEQLEIAGEFVEKRSAKMPGRPVFNEMLKRVQKGETSGIVCWKLDRLARNPVDGGQISWLLQENIIQHIRTHDRSHYPTDNVLMMSVEFGMANQFIRDLSSNVKRGLRLKVKRGEFPSTAPVGYLNDVRAKTIVVDRKKSKIIRAAFELYAKGNSRLEDISRFLFDNGVRSFGGLPFHKDRVKFILTNAFYVGLFTYGGEMHEGRHTPIIEKRLFDKVQKVIIERGHPMKATNAPKALCGLLRCGECGMGITAEERTKYQQNGNVHRYVYYRCTKKKGGCAQPHIREEALLPQLNAILSGYAMPSVWQKEFEKLIAEDEQSSSLKNAAFVQELREKVHDLSRKLDRLTDLYIAQDIERGDYLARRRTLVMEKKSVEEQCARLEANAGHWLEPMREWLKDASLLDEAAQSEDIPSKKSSLQKIFGSNLHLQNKEVQEIPAMPWSALRAARSNFRVADASFIRAGGLGIGPRFTASKAAVLPLDDPPI